MLGAFFVRGGELAGHAAFLSFNQGHWEMTTFPTFPLTKGTIPRTPQMTPLRQKMIRELEVQRKRPNTVNSYVTAVVDLAARACP